MTNVYTFEKMRDEWRVKAAAVNIADRTQKSHFGKSECGAACVSKIDELKQM
jgi:hypothetical protein